MSIEGSHTTPWVSLKPIPLSNAKSLLDDLMPLQLPNPVITLCLLFLLSIIASSARIYRFQMMCGKKPNYNVLNNFLIKWSKTQRLMNIWWVKQLPHQCHKAGHGTATSMVNKKKNLYNKFPFLKKQLWIIIHTDIFHV